MNKEMEQEPTQKMDKADSTEKQTLESNGQADTQGRETTSSRSPSKIGRFFKKALRWTVGVALVFALGVSTAWFIRVRPQSVELQNQLQELNSLQAEYESLQSEVNDLRPLAAENKRLEEELAEAEIHTDLLKILVDLTSAQLGLAENDSLTAEKSLEGTDQRLEDLQDRLSEEAAQDILDMRSRLQLAIEGLENDDFAAKRDLEILSNDLVTLETILFDE